MIDITNLPEGYCADIVTGVRIDADLTDWCRQHERLDKVEIYHVKDQNLDSVCYLVRTPFVQVDAVKKEDALTKAVNVLSSLAIRMEKSYTESGNNEKRETD